MKETLEADLYELLGHLHLDRATFNGVNSPGYDELSGAIEKTIEALKCYQESRRLRGLRVFGGRKP